MTTMILNVTFDCTDASRVARFWAAASGWPLRQRSADPGHGEYSAGPPADSRQGGPRFYFVTVPEPKTVKNRLHLDLLPASGSQQGEIAWLVKLGATVAESQVPGAGWEVTADSEGNEFCLEPGPTPKATNRPVPPATAPPRPPSPSSSRRRSRAECTSCRSPGRAQDARRERTAVPDGPG